MPLTSKGSKIMENMKDQYGNEKGENVFYASKNKGTIEGVDAGTSEGARKAAATRAAGGGGGGKSAMEKMMKNPAQTKSWSPETWKHMSEGLKSARDQQPGMATSPSAAGAPGAKNVWPGRVV
jgi:hypothetical protein